MRIGNNPEKESNILEIDSYHRVIIPVYIPNLTEDYFKDGLKILKLCLGSLLHTIHSKTRVSIINNGSCKEVCDYLTHIFNSHNQIDQYLHSKLNLGKINALFSAIKSNREPLITIADSDVMFLTNWQKEVEEILKLYSEAGMVSPVPPLGSLKGSYIRSTLGFAYLHGKPKYEKVKNIEGIRNFQRSIGRNIIFDEESTKYYTVTKKGKKAVMGCGHFMATLRASVFNNSPNKPSLYKIVGGSEKLYIDGPNDKSGHLKLATIDNFGYHLGNKYENWMNIEFSKVLQNNEMPKASNFDFSISKPNKIYYILGLLIQRLIIKNRK